jgi:CheY-like chemotaxis protein
MLKGGLVYADYITTVSETYAEEIKYPFYGEQLDGLLRARSASLRGILNGIDYNIFDPANDQKIFAEYGPATAKAKKAVNKEKLQEQLGLPVDKDKYMIVLDHQPNDYTNEAATDADLVLSGHTHGGQLFPITYIGEWFGVNDRTYGYEKREGTEFIVTLNWKYTHKNNEQDMLDYSVLRGKNILLVENNMLNAEITRNILSNQGMMMDLASDGKQGVAMFTHAMPHTYDAILMDIRMPVMDGLEATSRIRHSTHPEAEIIPIIAMTADAFDEDRKKTADAGMNAHITKPIDPEELYITLTNYLHH